MPLARGSQPAARKVEVMVMRYVVLLSALVCFASCTKRNPNLCCTDEASCARVDEPEPRPCDDDLSCRANHCVAEVCASAAECNADAPFCATGTGLCAATCEADAQCPGFAGAAELPYCVTGACVACRDGGDCGVASPICDDNACRGCTDNTECASGACAADGACVDESAISYVSPTGTAGAPCTKMAPCSIEHALEGSVPRTTVVLASGTYAGAAEFAVTGTRRLIGDASSKPILTRTTNGPILTIQLASSLVLEHLVVTGAKGEKSEPLRGDGIACGNLGQGTGGGSLTIVDSEIRRNASNGVQGRACSFSAVSSHFDNNGASGVRLTDGNSRVDGCTFISNTTDGANLDGGEAHVTNSIAARNGSTGFAIYADTGNSTLDFNTAVDNRVGLGGAQTGASTLTARNNLLVRNSQGNLFCDPCTLAGNVVVGSDLSAVKFQSPDAPPYDYHLLAGSSAIDAATDTTAVDDHDIDGEPRPTGAAADVGADEFVP